MASAADLHLFIQQCFQASCPKSKQTPSQGMQCLKNAHMQGCLKFQLQKDQEVQTEGSQSSSFPSP